MQYKILYDRFARDFLNVRTIQFKQLNSLFRMDLFELIIHMQTLAIFSQFKAERAEFKDDFTIFWCELENGFILTHFFKGHLEVMVAISQLEMDPRIIR